MATTYLQLVNDINARVNEVQLTSANFATASGHYQVAKQAINDAIRRIVQQQFEWPFFHVEYDETLVEGQIRYDYQTNCKSVDFDSFRIQRNATFGNQSQYLRRISYEEYLRYKVDDEYNTSNTSIRGLPKFVFETLDQNFGVWPAPDNAYTLTYEYFKYPTDLSAYNDTMELPDSFRHVVVDMAMYFIYQFRSDYENADRVLNLALENIKDLRTIFINRYDRVVDTRIVKGYGIVNTLRVSSLVTSSIAPVITGLPTIGVS